MSQITKKLIVESTFKLAASKPFQRITVKNITDDLGITRNSFYYYFHDTYDVAKSYIQSLKENILNDSENPESVKIITFTKQIAKDRRAWLSIYNAVGYDNLSAFIQKEIHETIVGYIEKLAGKNKMQARDIHILSEFYEQALSGVLLRWIKNDAFFSTPSEIEDNMNRITVLFKGQLELAVSNALNSN